MLHTFQLILVHVEIYSVKTVAGIAMTNALVLKLLVSAPKNMLTQCLTIARKPVDVEMLKYNRGNIIKQNKSFIII